MHVNVLSRIPSALWERELPDGLGLSFSHSSEPVEADIHVVYGLRTAISIPNKSCNTIFVASEPPEIRQYNLDVLRKYSAVLGPGFSYLQALPNFSTIEAVCPWWVGLASSGSEHYANTRMSPSFTRQSFHEYPAPVRDRLSVIVSSQSRTPLQQQRQRLVDFLHSRLNEIDVFGRGRAQLADKADVLGVNRYHLAVENSFHPGYWTEKLADPVLMNNYVFYGGHSSYRTSFDAKSIQEIDPYDFERAYATISEALNEGLWHSTETARQSNRRTLLDSLSFHRSLAKFIEKGEFHPARNNRFFIPAQHPQKLVKKILDPLYGGLRRLL